VNSAMLASVAELADAPA